MLRLIDTPWSYSALEGFETCPRNFNATRGPKATHKEPYMKSKADGLDVHAAMQAYVERGAEPPIGLRKFKGIVDRVTDGATDITCEIKFGLRADLSPCDFFDKDVSMRVAFDLNALRKDSIAQLDYKTSARPRESDLQLQLYALAALMRWTNYEQVWGAFVYTHFNARPLLTERKQIPKIIETVNPRVERLRLAREEDDWPERQSWKCGFCPVRECRFNNPAKGVR
jgi:hypothetical protein